MADQTTKAQMIEALRHVQDDHFNTPWVRREQAIVQALVLASRLPDAPASEQALASSIAEAQDALLRAASEPPREAFDEATFWRDLFAAQDSDGADGPCERLARQLHADGYSMDEVVAIATGGGK